MNNDKKEIALNRGHGKSTLTAIQYTKEMMKKNPKEFFRRMLVDTLKKNKQ